MSDQEALRNLKQRERELNQQIAELKKKAIAGANVAYELSRLRNDRQAVKSELGKLEKRLQCKR